MNISENFQKSIFFQNFLYFDSEIWVWKVENLLEKNGQSFRLASDVSREKQTFPSL